MFQKKYRDGMAYADSEQNCGWIVCSDFVVLVNMEIEWLAVIDDSEDYGNIIINTNRRFRAVWKLNGSH